MNLKEAFRYQKFLNTMMNEASYRVGKTEYCYRFVYTHKYSKADPEIQDETEIAEPGKDLGNGETYYPCDDMINLMSYLVELRRDLSGAISNAKAGAGVDIDAEIAANKFLQSEARAIQKMLQRKAQVKTEMSTAYRLNKVEGNQVPFRYEMDIDTQEAYNRQNAKKVLQEINKQSDEASSIIDATMITTNVDFNPPFDVNDSFDDVMEKFIQIAIEELDG